ncbi:MAG TPA: 23S rRNA (guanosine(2251)-2'-O)-methyltransferase RlmB, partial [Candidatus Limnocylindria bacterium]|nr:23S rRNA (guanosine(2251)-2'-O)-methyltransferase RlmB [Candidatus Limnocylindria bacterium]
MGYRPAPAAPAPPLEEGEELVAGRRPVEEAFAAERPARRLLVTPQRREALERIVLHATTLRIPIVEVEGGSLTALAGFDGHQGVAVVVEARRFASVDDLLARSIERAEAPFVIVLDSLEDPQNVGTLLRSAEAAGVHGVVFPTERQAPLSPAAIKASAGATEHLLLAPVDDLPGTLTDLHLRGLRIVGSDADAPMTAREADLRGPIAIIVGSEGHGLSPAVRRRCDLFVRIPMKGVIGSLNAAVAGSILAFEVLGQRDPGAKPTPAAPTTTRARGLSVVARSDDAAWAPGLADTETPEAQVTEGRVEAGGVSVVPPDEAAPDGQAEASTVESVDPAPVPAAAAPRARRGKAVTSEAAARAPDGSADPNVSAFASLVKARTPRKQRTTQAIAVQPEAEMTPEPGPASVSEADAEAGAADLLPDDTA